LRSPLTVPRNDQPEPITRDDPPGRSPKKIRYKPADGCQLIKSSNHKSLVNLSSTQARKVALRAQGLDKRNFDNAGSRVSSYQLVQMIHRMGALQIDAINTVVRSHYLPLYSRLGPYDCDLLDQKVFLPKLQAPRHRKTFEYWGHECSLLPIELFPNFRWRMDDAREGRGIYKQLARYAKANRPYLETVKAKIADSGPLTVRDFGDSARKPGMWEWGPAKLALEYLFWSGELSSVGRNGFQRVYDLSERAIPDHLLQSDPLSRSDAQKNLLLLAAKALGVGTAADLRDYFRLSAKDANPLVEQLLEQGELVRCEVENWSQSAFALPDLIKPKRFDSVTLLSPFDPVVWYRDRAKRLFGFEYKIEIYVPKAKRKYGYYVMPLLVGEHVVARVDLKADRVNSKLDILGFWLEVNQDSDHVISALRGELLNLSHWLGLDAIEISRNIAFANEIRRNL